MKRVVLGVVFVLVTGAVFAADAPKAIVITATPEELQALDSLIDAGVKSQGLLLAENGVYWHKKLVQAVADANKPAAPAAVPAPADNGSAIVK